jgi:hypothetical protein
MGRIIGTDESLNRVKEAKAGDKSVYINWNAINDLPDDFEVVISKVEFDIQKDFSDVGNKTYMPSPALHYVIAEAKGISGFGDEKVEAVYELVNINLMEFDGPPKMIKMLTGYQCTKQSKVTMEDGTERLSSPCTSMYNVWNRCCEYWSKEEEATKGYDPSVVKVWPSGDKYYERTYYQQTKQVPLKYDTKYKRRAHFYSELKFAQQKAETKAFEKTIRELAGLMTGYKAEDLIEKAWYFAKVRRSKEVLKLETASRLIALERGENSGAASQKMLYGAQGEDEPARDVIEETTPPVKEEERPNAVDITAKVFEEPKTATMARILKKYLQDKESAGNIENWQQATALMDWLDKGPDITTGQNTEWWNRAIDVLKTIEGKLPEWMREKGHNLY